MQILIVTLLGHKIYLEVNPSDTVEDIKGELADKVGFPPDQQRLIFNGAQLEDNKTLSYYKIVDKSKIHFIPRLRGGHTFDKIKNEVKEFLLENNEKNKENNSEEKINILNENNIFSSNNTLNNSKNIIIQSNAEEKISSNINLISDEKEEKFKENIIEPDIKKEIVDEKIFSSQYLKRNELNVNLIYFDLKMTNKENYFYFNNLKVDVVGGFHSTDDLNILQNYLDKIKDKNIPFIVISSGTSGKDVIKICLKYQFVKEIIIFCRHYNYNEHYIKEYPGYVKKVFTNIKQVYEYIKTFGGDKNEIKKYIDEDKYIFSQDEINMDKQIQECPLISALEYDRCYFLVHKVYSHFFGDINNKYEESKFRKENLNKIIEYLSELKFEKDSERNNMLDKFKNLSLLETNDQFIEKSIREYTSESNFCYLFNRVMRNSEKGLISFAYYMGPLLYGLNKYVKENPKFAMTKSIKLYRIIKCSKLEFYQYKLNYGHIICLPSLTSTSSAQIKFKPSKLSQKTNENKDEMIGVKMIFKYTHQKGNISPGIIIEDKKLKDGSYLSCHPKEKEVLLFPFTFAKIKEIKAENKNSNKIFVVKLEIVNRKSYIEYTLKNNFETRILFSKLEQKK